MATFETHTEGGSWTGGGSEVPNCTAAQRAVLNTAMVRIQKVLDGWNLPCLTSVRDRLQDRLDCSLVIDCPGCTDKQGFTTRGSANVSLCNTALGGTQARATAVLFHEMVHSVGGTELDAEALENHFFGGGNGASFPSSPDFPKFRSDGGEFVIWDEATGNVFERCVEGGSWSSSPTVTQGVRLNVNFPSPPVVSGGGGSWV